MARFRDNLVRSQTSGSLLAQRLIVIFLVVTGITLMVLGRINHPSLQAARLQAMAFVTPIVGVVSAPVEAVHGVVSDWDALVRAHQINAKLRAENDGLRHWQSVAVALSRENTNLRTLARYKPVAKTAYLTAKVVGHSQSAFGQGLLLNVGAADGVKPYQPVIDAFGLMGRTVEVSENASRLMLITDPGSRIPVTVGTSGQRAIVTGTGDGMLQLLFVPPAHHIKVGDMVMSTEDGGLLPSALAIGEVVQVEDRHVRVKPMHGVGSADYVRVVQFTAPNANSVSK